MPSFREHAGADRFQGGFDGPGELPMPVHGQVTPAQAAMFNERLQRLAQDFAQQHLAGQKLPAADKQACTLLIGGRQWRFAPFSFDPALRWLGLEVRRHVHTDDGHAVVEFVARSKLGGRAMRLHETSRFVREGGRWFYVNGALE